MSLHVGFDLHGPEIGLSINLLPANMGGGVISNLKFEIRLGIHVDSSTKGSGCAFALFFNLGEYLHPDLSLLDWSNPNISLSEFAQLMLRELRPVTLNIDPFVFRFTFILGVRRIDVSGIPEFGICLTADAGLGVSFDVGVANGGASVTVGARFCPDVRTGFIVSVGVMVVNSLRSQTSTCFLIGSKLRCIRSTSTEMQSISENDFECLANTEVNAPGTMFPDFRCFEY